MGFSNPSTLNEAHRSLLDLEPSKSQQTFFDFQISLSKNRRLNLRAVAAEDLFR